MSLYRIPTTWPLRYRGHEPGETFVGDLEPDVEARALSLGAIEILDDTRESVSLVPSKAPRGWDAIDPLARES